MALTAKGNGHYGARFEALDDARDEFFAPLYPCGRERFFRMLERLVERPG